MAGIETVEKGKDYKDMGKRSVWLFFGVFLGRFLGIIFTIIIARLFPLEEVGIYYLAFSVISLFTVFTGFEFVSTLQTYGAYYNGSGKTDHLRKLVKLSFILGAITSIITFAFFIFFSKDISLYFGNTQVSSPLKILAIYFILNSFFGLAIAFVTVFRLMKEVSITQISQLVSKILLIPVVLYFFGANAASLSLIFIISFSIGVIISLYYFFILYKSIEKPRIEKITYSQLIMELLPFTSAIIITNIISTVFSSSDRILLGYFMEPISSASLIAVYSISLGFGTFLQIFSSAIGGIFIPIIASIHGRDEKDFSKINNLTNSSTKWSFLATGPLFLFFMIYPSEILGTLYGPDYSSGGSTLFLIILGFLFFTLGYSQKNAFSALKRADLGFKITIVGVISNIGLNLMLIPRLGIEGAAFSFMFFYFVTSILAAYYSKKFFGFNFSSWLLPFFGFFLFLFVTLSFVRVSLFSVINSFIASPFSSFGLSHFSVFFVLGLLFLFMTSIYVVGAVYLRLLDRNDIKLLSSFLRKLKVPSYFINIVNKLPYSES